MTGRQQLLSIRTAVPKLCQCQCPATITSQFSWKWAICRRESTIRGEYGWWSFPTDVLCVHFFLLPPCRSTTVGYRTCLRAFWTSFVSSLGVPPSPCLVTSDLSFPYLPLSLGKNTKKSPRRPPLTQLWLIATPLLHCNRHPRPLITAWRRSWTCLRTWDVRPVQAGGPLLNLTTRCTSWSCFTVARGWFKGEAKHCQLPALTVKLVCTLIMLCFWKAKAHAPCHLPIV